MCNFVDQFFDRIIANIMCFLRLCNPLIREREFYFGSVQLPISLKQIRDINIQHPRGMYICNFFSCSEIPKLSMKIQNILYEIKRNYLFLKKIFGLFLPFKYTIKQKQSYTSVSLHLYYIREVNSEYYLLLLQLFLLSASPFLNVYYNLDIHTFEYGHIH